MTIQGRALDWFMKFVHVPTGPPTKTLAKIRKGLIEEFIKPKYEVQYIIELKENKQYPNETIWDFDQRFKMLMERVIFDISDDHHKECFIIVLVPHIRMSLMHQKIVT